MNVIEDVWVNWFEDAEKAYEVCDFPEWRNSDDNVLLMDKMPLLLIKPDLFTYIEDTLNPVPIDLLKKIENASSYRMFSELVTVKYACVLTDGNRVIAINTNNGQKPHKKSRLIFRQQTNIYKLLDGMELEEFDYTPIQKKVSQFLVVPSESMFGLTRRERALKEIMFYIFDQLQYEEDIHRLRYYYSEWNPKDYSNINKLNYDELFVTLFGEVKLGWSDEHHLLLKKMLKMNPLYQKLYDKEMSYEFNQKGKKK